MIMHMICCFFYLISLAGGWSPQTVLAQGIAVDRKDIQVDPQEFKEVASQLRCPTCTGLSVLDSDAAFSVQIKNEVKSQLAAGKSERDILGFFMERYGPWILRSPPVQGVNALAWFVPVAAMILGPLLIIFFFWRRSKGKQKADAPETSLSMEEVMKDFEERLQRMRGAKS